MHKLKCLFGLIITILDLKTCSSVTDPQLKDIKMFSGSDKDICSIIIIAHRGASGYVPEHTLGAYALAITMGADYIELDLVMTSDGHLVVRHDNELSMTSDVILHPEFASRQRNQAVDGINMTGWFTEDFTLAELKTLRAIERISLLRPGNARMDGTFTIPTLQEILDLVCGFQYSQKRTIGIYLEIKHSTHFRRLGLAMEDLLVQTLYKNGYLRAGAPVYIQSYEISNLRYLSNITKVKLTQLLDSNKSAQPIDEIERGTGLTYGDMATAKGLLKVAKYASAVGPDKSFIIPRNKNNKMDEPTSFVADAHAAGLQVHTFTFRAENSFLPDGFHTVIPFPTTIGNLSGELKAYFDAGIDGLFTDQPDIAVRMREQCQPF